MPGSFGSPYRAPCSGWPAQQTWFLGGPFQHQVSAAEAVPLHANITTVPDYHLPAGADIAPYVRFDNRITWPDTGTCPGPGQQPNTTCAQVTPGMAPCGPWLGPDGDDRPSGGSVDHNAYATASSATVDLSACRKLGFKNVQARKYWHGRFGYLSHDFNAVGATGSFFDRIKYTDLTPLCACDVEFEQPAPSAALSKYRSAVYATAYSITTVISGGTPSTTTLAAAVSRSATVNRYSGVITLTPSAAMTSGADPGGFIATAWSILNGHLGKTAMMTRDAYVNYAGVITDSETVTEAENAGVYTLTGLVGETPVVTVSYTPATGAFEAYWYETDGTTVKQHEVFTWSNTGFSHTLDVIQNLELTTITTHAQTTGVLSDAYAGSDLVTDAVGLLAYWPLNDDVVYPWRTDEQVAIAPLMSYDEVPSAVSPDGGQCYQDDGTTPWTDPNAALYSGVVRGAPLAAGQGPHFDWLHETWRVCADDAGHKAPYRFAYGAWSAGFTPLHAASGAGDATDQVVPATATQWTQNSGQAPVPGYMPSGAWMVFGPQVGVDSSNNPVYDTGCLVAQKWAEIKVPRPSVNFARPCGPDRLAIDPVSARCATYLAATPPRVTLDSATSIATGDRCLVAGVTGVATGIYQVAKVSDTVYELTTVVQLSCGPVVLSDPGAGLLGKLRWPLAPGLGGRIAVAAAAQSGSSVALTLAAAAPYLYSGDLVDLTGVAGLGSSLAATVTDATHLTVPGTLSGAYAGGGFLSSHGAADYSWYDDQPKGDFYKVDWSFSYRDYQERQRVVDQASACANCPDLTVADPTPLRPNQAGHGMPRAVSALQVTASCLPFQVCCPQVICLSPSAETWTNGVTYAFPAFAPDARYGARWQSAIVQTMADPLWEAPRKLCVAGDNGSTPTACPWVEDLGTCQADQCDESTGQTARYYAQRPWVEGRATVPTGAPAMPAGCEINILGLGDLNGSTVPAGVVLPPPQGLGYVDADNGADPMQPMPAVTPWGLYLRELGCVCANGVFAAPYQANGVTC